MPTELHWFCHTYASDPSTEDHKRVKSEHAIGENLDLRREQVCECLKLFAFNGDDAIRYQNELADGIDQQLSRCDLCVVGYYKSRQQLAERLRVDYDEEEVIELVRLFNARDITRITRGLDIATEILKKADPSSRHKSILSLPSQLALFEALCCDAFLKDETLLQAHFQEPFRLVQTNRRLKITHLVPAATIFLFDVNEDRSNWATYTWSKYAPVPSEEDFNFAIRDGLFKNMQLTFEDVPDMSSLQRLWFGIGLIVNKLDNSLVTHSLRAMDIDVFRLALEHLKYDTKGLRLLIQTIQKLLDIAPRDFWDSMGAISPTTFIEQIFHNPQYARFMEQATEIEDYESSALYDMLSWIKPFMASLETVHKARACRSIASQLLDRLQNDRFPLVARIDCKQAGLATLAWTLEDCNKEGAILGHTGRVVAAETLGVTGDHIKDIMMIPSLPTDDRVSRSCSETCLKIIKNALALECKSLRTNQEALSQNKELPNSYASYSPAIWDAVVQHLDRGNVTIARAALAGINDLTGLEKFKINAHDIHTKEKSGFNVKFGRLTHLVCQILERTNDFNPNHLDKLFKQPETAYALVAALFSPDASLYEAGVNLIKSISSESARKEAIGHLLKTFPETTLNAFSWAIRRIARNRTFASCPRMLKTSNDVLEVLCDSQNGLLRTRTISSLSEIRAVENFWEHQWEGLRLIYEMTEKWGKEKVAQADVLKEFCRDTMQFSQRLFDQYSIFANAISSAVPFKQEQGPAVLPGNGAGKELLKHPAKIMEAMVKWLRLRDAFLIEISVKLTTKVLDRLSELGMKVLEGPCDFLEQILNNGSQARSNLQLQEKAELARALEVNLGRSLASVDHSRGHSISFKSKSKNGVIDMDAWKSSARTTTQPIEVSDDEFGDSELLDHDFLNASRSADSMKTTQVNARGDGKLRVPERKHPQARDRTANIHSTSELKNVKAGKANLPSEAERALFREKREKEREAKRKRDAETLALIKKKAGGAASMLGEGSGLGSIGVKGKDHAPKVHSMMVSSGSDSESEDELDRELFGSVPKITKLPNSDRYYKHDQSLQTQPRGPIKKARQFRSAKDMRARLAPDLTTLHRTLLGWEFFHQGDFPPGSDRDDYSLVTTTFRTPLDYQTIFEPLLVLEAWQGFLKSKEEGSFKPFEVKVATRMNVDAFLELSATMPLAESKDLGIGEADIVLISKSQSPSVEAQQAHCLARVWKINRKKTAVDITYRANVGNGLVSSMIPNATLYAVKVMSITPLEREYGALLGLKYFDLCDEIIEAKPSPLLKYTDKQLAPLITNYSINDAQAKAVRSAVDNDAFTLIQGPPGSGKTKTIVAIVGALLTGSFGDKGVPIARPQVSNGIVSRSTDRAATKKLLVCAPSNAAVDELVMRFKEGVKTSDGTLQKLSIIRIGRSDAINANVIDVTLEELVSAKLNLARGKTNSTSDDIHKIMMAHKATSDELNALKIQVDELKAGSKPVSSDQDRQFEVLKRRKQQLSNQIDTARDNGDVVAREAELNRRRVQQEILESAHVICATLSGSGHEMFQGLNIEFETVIIDEAAQSIELSALIPLKYGCSKCILVGDPKQLPPTVLSRDAARFQYEQSLFVRMQGNHPSDVHLLDTQYRMHPDISAFPSKTFYDAKLLDGPGMETLRRRPWHQSAVFSPYRFFDVQGHHQNAPRGHSLINLAEIDVALKLFDRLITDCKGYNFRGKVGVITPYKSQLRELRSRFAQRYSDSIFATIDFNTTDAFQGRESEIIIFSCVRASLGKGVGFLSDIRRMNVGITRAKCSLWVLGNSKSLMQGEYWGRLIRDAQSRDRYTSGDLNALLMTPLMTLDSETLANKSRDSPMTSHSSSSGHDINMPDAPNLEGFIASSSSHTSASVGTPQDNGGMDDSNVMAYHPAGGANGLNSNGNCQKCGSFTHHTHLCNNNDAKAQTTTQCFRCKGSGHTKASCTAERCFTCGEFGHTQRTCTSTKFLANKDKMRIGKQEAEHNLFLQQASEMHRKRQLGDHDKKVPTVRLKSSTPPLGHNHKKAVDHAHTTGLKRRRDSSPDNVYNGPKIAKGAPVEDEHNASIAPLHRQPPSKSYNWATSSQRANFSPTERSVPSNTTSIASNGRKHSDQIGLRETHAVNKSKENVKPSTTLAKQSALQDNHRQANRTSIERAKDYMAHRTDRNIPSDGMNKRQANDSSSRHDNSNTSGNGTSVRQEHRLSDQAGSPTTSTIIKVGDKPPEGHPVPSLPPPPPNRVRVPKKKEVDPFIRPKRRP